MSIPINPPFLFDQAITATHPWYDAWQADADKTGLDARANYANLAMEQRIDAKAQASFFIAAAPEVQAHHSVVGAMGPYFLRQYCRPASQVKFLSTEVRLPRKHKLLHIGSLTRSLTRLLRTHRVLLRNYFRDRFYAFDSIPGQGDWSAKQWVQLASLLKQEGEAGIRDVVEQTHRWLGQNTPFWWATPALEVESTDQDISALVHRLGLGSTLKDELLLIYEYEVKDAGLLYRPSSIETNAYPFHYPSPAHAQTGWTMPLLAHLTPCREIIHHPLTPERARQSVRPQVYVLTSNPADQYQHLATHRTRHRNYLSREYSRHTDAQTWLTRHAKAF